MARSTLWPLADRLVAGPPSYAVWLDVRDLQPGPDWDEQIANAIQTCRALLLLMTVDSMQDHSACKSEWVWALKYKKPVIPLRVDAGAGLPFRLSSRQYIDFSVGFDIGVARLRTYLDSVGSPKWVLQELRYQLAEAERELPRANPTQRLRVEHDIQDLRKRIADQRQLVDNPEATARRSEERINAGLEQARHPERPDRTPALAMFVNAPPVVAPEYFQDRHVEFELMGNFLRAADERLMTVVGRGGVGKTAMVCRLLKALEGGRLPDELGELDVDGIVYLSPAGEHPVNFPNLFRDLCRLLPPEAEDRLLQRYRDPQQTPAALMGALLDAVPRGRVVVLLDQAEDIIDTSSSDFVVTDEALDEALRTLLAAPTHGVKVILTTRVAPRALLLVHPERQRPLPLGEGLRSPYAQEVLRARDPDGRLGLKTAPDELLDQARQRTRGYPRALEALAAILAVDRDTTLPELVAQTTRLPENVVEVLVGEAFNRLDPLDQQVMQALAIFMVPVPSVAVDYLLQPYRPAVHADPVLTRLVNMQFVRRDAGRYYLHQVDRDYALSRIPAGEPADRDADSAPFTQQALLHRGADYFAQTRIRQEDWKTLNDLAPQLNEYELRCQGRDYDTAAHILLAIDSDYLIHWGHYRLTAQMHERLQGHLDDREADATSKERLGHCYRALGQIPRAIDLFQQVQAIACEIGNRKGEGVALANLGNCYFELGYLAAAVEISMQGLSITREIGDRGQEASFLDNLGNCYRDLGQLPKAIDLYQQALNVSREIGYRYEESYGLIGLANANADLRAWGQAAEYSRQAIEVADAISNLQIQSDARLSLARIKLLIGDLQAARQAALDAHERAYPHSRAQVSLLLGITNLRKDQPAAATQEFRDAINQADELLRYAGDAYEMHYTKALALCGLALTTDQAKATEAIAPFRAARAITSAEGIIKQNLALFDTLVLADRDGILSRSRAVVAGNG